MCVGVTEREGRKVCNLVNQVSENALVVFAIISIS